MTARFSRTTARVTLLAVCVGLLAFAVRLVVALTTTATLDELLDSPVQGGCKGPLALADGFPLLHRVGMVCTGLSHVGLDFTRGLVAFATSLGIGALVYVLAQAWGTVGALVAGGLLAVSPAALDAGFLARPYGFEFLGACVLVAGFVRVVVLSRGPAWWLAGAVVCMTSTYPSWLLTGITAAGIVWFRRAEIRRAPRPWWWMAGSMGALTVVLILLARHDFGYQEGLSNVTVKTNPKVAAVTMLTVVTGPAMPTDLADLGNDTPAARVAVLALMLAAAGLAFVGLAWSVRRDGVAAITLAASVPLVLAVAFIGAFLAGIDIRPRHYYHLAVPLAALVGLGAARWRSATAVRLTSGLLVVLVVVSAGLRATGQGAPPEDMREAARDIERIAGPEDSVYVVAGFMILPFNFYADGHGLDVWRGVSSVDDLPGFARWLASAPADDGCDLWIVASKLDVPDPDGTLLPMLEPAVAEGRGYSIHRAGSCRATTWEPPVPPEPLGGGVAAPEAAAGN